MVNELDCVDLGLSCTHVWRVLNQGTNRGQPDELSQYVDDAVNRLTL